MHRCRVLDSAPGAIAANRSGGVNCLQREIAPQMDRDGRGIGQRLARFGRGVFHDVQECGEATATVTRTRVPTSPRHQYGADRDGTPPDGERTTTRS